MEVKSSKILSIDEVIEVLEDTKGSTEMSYEQQLALQHAKKFSMTKHKGEKMTKELKATGLLNERSIIKIVEVQPKNQMTLRQILAQEKKGFSDEEVTKILAIANEK